MHQRRIICTCVQNPAVTENDTLDYSQATNVTVVARHVIVATAPDVAARLTYEPPLPEPHVRLGSMVRLWDDPAVQILFVFKTDFWNKRGVGTCAFYSEREPCSIQEAHFFISRSRSRSRRHVCDAGTTSTGR